MILIGLDEAGYGPRMGPLCHGYCAIRVEDPVLIDRRTSPTPPELFELLHPRVMRHPAAEGSVTVDDSKKVYAAGAGLALLRRGIGAFAACVGQNPAVAESEFHLEHLLPLSDRMRLEEDSWGCMCAPRHEDSPPIFKKTRKQNTQNANPAPVDLPGLRETMKKKGVSVLALGARAMSAKHYNQALRKGENKADVNWNVIAEQLVKMLPFARPGEHIHAWIDRQGGRKFYTAKLGALFGGAMPWVELETPSASIYRIECEAGTVRVAFLVNADGLTLPVALASMAAKLARELCMQRFNNFFQSHAPEIKPTAGYYGDARRFLTETRTLRKKLGIANRELVRLR